MTVDSLLCTILFTSLVANGAYSVPAPYMPLEFKRIGIDQIWIGWIFAFYSIAIVCVSPFVPKIISKFGRRSPVIFGMFLMGLSFLQFGLLHKLKANTTYYITYAILSRAIQGTASTMIQTTLYSIITNSYPERQMEVIGYLQAAEGGGLILGPFVGAFLFMIGGYNFTFYGYGSLCIILGLVIVRQFKRTQAVSDQNEVQGDLFERPAQENNQEQDGISVFKLMINPQFLFTGLTSLMTYFSFNAIGPILAIRLQDFEMTQFEISLVFMILPLFWALSGVLSPKCIVGKYSNQKIILMSMVLQGV